MHEFEIEGHFSKFQSNPAIPIDWKLGQKPSPNVIFRLCIVKPKLLDFLYVRESSIPSKKSIPVDGGSSPDIIL